VIASTHKPNLVESKVILHKKTFKICHTNYYYYYYYYIVIASTRCVKHVNGSWIVNLWLVHKLRNAVVVVVVACIYTDASIDLGAPSRHRNTRQSVTAAAAAAASCCTNSTYCAATVSGRPFIWESSRVRVRVGSFSIEIPDPRTLSSSALRPKAISANKSLYRP